MKSKWQINLVALYTLIRKEVIRFTRIWSQTLLPPAITMALYFIIFGKLIGSQIQRVDGFTYMEYIVPGLVMMSIITNAYANTAASFFSTKFSKSIEEMLVSPMPSYVMLLGFMFGGTLRGLCVGVIVIFISLFFTHLEIHNYFIVFSIAILASMLFSLAGLINAIFAKKFDDIAFIPTFVLTPLTYLGGVFYSIKQLPELWQKISFLNPIVAIVDTFRYGILGISDLNVWVGFSITVLSLVIGYVASLWLLKKGFGVKA